MRKIITLGIMLLFLGMTISSSVGFNLENQSTVATFDGDTLYVGGNGTGNYTKIQNAIDDANNGDTVFVYDDSSPYYENVVVNKSINLIGENKETTVIDGSGSGNVVNVSVDWVNISGFTITNCETWKYGISIDANNTLIFDNIITNNQVGIVVWKSSCIITRNIITYCHDFGIAAGGSNTIISENTMTYNGWGIFLSHSDMIRIEDNIISDGGCGIISYISGNTVVSGNIISNHESDGINVGFGSEIYYNTISNAIFGIDLEGNEHKIGYNTISDTNVGIWIEVSSNNEIFQNKIKSNIRGIYFELSDDNVISKNDFIENGLNIDWWNCHRMSFKNNYWDKPRIIPKLIWGTKVIRLTPYKDIEIPWFFIDWRPALRPYDIGV